jgi:hypothetical protein
MTTDNERKTENVVRDEFRRLKYYDASGDIRVGKGSPEFIVSSPSSPDFLVIVECKANPKDHASARIQKLLSGNDAEELEEAKAKRLQRYAADGVLHYAKSLSREFSVIAVAVSGETKKGASVSTFLHTKGEKRPKQLLLSH